MMITIEFSFVYSDTFRYIMYMHNPRAGCLLVLLAAPFPSSVSPSRLYLCLTRCLTRSRLSVTRNRSRHSLSFASLSFYLVLIYVYISSYIYEIHLFGVYTRNKLSLCLSLSAHSVSIYIRISLF